MPLTLDAFIDLSGSPISGAALRHAVERWQQPESLGAIDGCVRIVVPRQLQQGLPALSDRWSATGASPIAVLSSTMAEAGHRGAALLVLTGDVDATCEALGVLHQRLARDPMFGFAMPRIGCVDRCCIARLSAHGIGETDWVPRRVLADLPESELLVEAASPCVLVAPQVLGNFGPLDAEFEGLGAAMLHYMATARRCGFRTVLCNRAVVGFGGLTCSAAPFQPLPSFSERDRLRLARLVPDLERSWQEFRAASWERFERLCTSTIGGRGGSTRPSVLFDVRNVRAGYNGTTHAALGLVSAFLEFTGTWDVALLAHPEGAAFHNLARSYPDWPIYTSMPDRAFTVALRPSQPWHIQEMVDLHAVSLINAYLVLDTISWDIAYWAPPHLEGVWQFLADHADALMYDSDFTRQRFVERFPTGATVPNVVTHFSLDPKDYARTDAATAAAEKPFIFVIGNELDHKDVRQTVATLAAAFPFRHIKALGPADMGSPFVSAVQSGTVAEVDIHRLYANAEYIVYPSFYEGFGFPMLTALAYGRTVLARRSALVDELAAHCDRRGRLLVFDRREELVDLLGRLLHGEAVPEVPLGAGRPNGRPRGWHDVARDTNQFLLSLANDSSRRRWIARERAVRQLVSYRS